MHRLGGFMRRHYLLVGAAVVIVLAGAGFLWREVKPYVAPVYRDVAYTVPTAPKLSAGTGETVYRVDPVRSEAAYAVGERFAGKGLTTARGTSHGIAGDLAVNRAHPGESRVGPIVVNIEQFHSDNVVRDARIRHDHLESHRYPLATFTTRRVTGMPASLPEAGPVHFSLVGDLKVRGVTKPVTWKAEARFVGDHLTATATTKVRLSDFGAGPISIAGLLKTEDEVALTLTLVASDPTRAEVPTEIAAPAAPTPKGGGPSFAKTVQPILESNCASCHNKGQVGAHDWQVDTAGDASATAGAVALVTGTRYMPPWPASDKGIALAHVRKLSTAQVDALAAWAKAGGPLDVGPETPVKPAAEPEVPLPRRDITMRIPKPYRGSLANKNDYRCFLVDPHFTTTTYLTGYTFEPGAISVVHHALVYRVPHAAKAEALRKDGADGKPGWGCYTGTALDSASAIGGRVGLTDLVGGWVPGQRPLDFGTGVGFKFRPGDMVVIQLHYHYDQKVVADQSQIVFEKARPGEKPVALEVFNPIAPVELPCTEGTTGPLCDRAAALKRIKELYGPISGAIPDYALRTCGKDPSEYADQTKGIGTTSCDTRVGTNGQIVDVLGHMHELGRSFRMTLNPGTPKEKVLLDIPTWNFDWQLNYQPVKPVTVRPDDVVRIECSWDRSLRPAAENKYLLFAEATEDEMCFATYTVKPTGTGLVRD